MRAKGRGFQGAVAGRPFGLGRDTIDKAEPIARGAKQPRTKNFPNAALPPHSRIPAGNVLSSRLCLVRALD